MCVRLTASQFHVSGYGRLVMSSLAWSSFGLSRHRVFGFLSSMCCPNLPQFCLPQSLTCPLSSPFTFLACGPTRASNGWQGRRVSNPQPSVLETDALPIELHPLRLGRSARERLHNAVRSPCHIFFLTNAQSGSRQLQVSGIGDVYRYISTR